MEAQIHELERQAYFTLLLAFKAQADAISWDKEGLITDIRKELRLSDDEHRELLAKASSDQLVRQIREWRRSLSQPDYDVVPSPTVPVSRKKQKTIQLSTAFPGPSSIPAVTKPFIDHDSSGALLVNESPPEALVGRRVWTKWPEDNSFYEAFIHQYDSVKGQHALVYDRGTEQESWEWVDLKEIPPEDIRWHREDPGMGNRGRQRGRSRERRSSQNLGGSASGSGRRGRRRPSRSQPRTEFSTSQIEKRVVVDVPLYNTEALTKEVEKVLDVRNPDPGELAKARETLKEQEQALLEALSKLSHVSDEWADPNVNIGKDNP